MNAVDFYKYINDNGIEYHWHDNYRSKERDVVFFLYYYQIQGLRDILHIVDFDDDGIPCIMKDGYFAFVASDILGPYNIELTDVFCKDDEGTNE